MKNLYLTFVIVFLSVTVYGQNNVRKIGPIMLAAQAYVDANPSNVVAANHLANYTKVSHQYFMANSKEYANAVVTAEKRRVAKQRKKKNLKKVIKKN